jgi:C1A family cysteine protease
MTVSNNTNETHMPINNKGLGWVPDVPDARDHIFSITKPEFLTQPLPARIDLRENPSMQFPLLDQGELGSCTANAISAAMTYASLKQGGPKQLSQVTLGDGNVFSPSRLFIYYNERVMEGSVASDAGAMLRDGIKSVNQLGACKEATWPYIISQFTTTPSSAAYSEAQGHQALLYRRLNNRDINQIKGCIAQGFPFCFGFAVFNSFMSRTVATTGIMPMPNLARENMIGGHAVLGAGYDDAKQVVIVRNSWGNNWGDKGYFYMPYKYITNTNYCDDFWTITLMEQEPELLK